MLQKKLKERKERYRKLDRALKKLFPHARIELNFGNPWELLVAVQLSAQCTDKRVNMITAQLFKTYRTLGDYVRAGQSVKGIAAFERAVRPCGYYRQKTKHILAAARLVHTRFGGRVPRTMEEMLELPGVARKTATVVLKEAYGIVAGITVDTHVIRFVQRFDLSDYTDPIKIERQLMEIVPKKEWGQFTHRVIQYGRYVAPARTYDSYADPLVRIYPPAGTHFRTVHKKTARSKRPSRSASAPAR